MAESKSVGGHAFPVPQDCWGVPRYSGMSLRDYFAGQAMGALILRPEIEGMIHGAEDRARRAYLYADAMLKARET